jgi:hypothetical protein
MVGALLLAAAVSAPQDSFPRWGVGPIAGYSGSLGFLGGAQVSVAWPTTVLSGEASASTAGAVTFGPRLQMRRGRLGLEASLLYEKQLDLDYYGRGNAGDPDTSASYDAEQQEARAVLTWHPRPGITLGGGLVARHSTTFDREDSPLWQSCPTALTGSEPSAGPLLRAAWFGRVLLPVRATGELLHQEGPDASYSRVRGQLAAYLPLGPTTVLAGRGRLDRHFGTASTPFPHQLFLGSETGLRGYRDGRFSGDYALLCSVELRQEVASLEAPGGLSLTLGAVGFGDLGQAAESFEGLAAGRFHAAGGIGMRVLLPGDMVLGFDGGFSPEGFALSTGFGHTF